MKKLLAMLLCLCLTVLLLASCSDITMEKYKEVLDKAYEQAPVFGQMSEISQLSGKNLLGVGDDLICLTSVDNGYTRYTIFNIADRDVVKEFLNSDTVTYNVSLESIYGTTFVLVNKTMTPAVGEFTYSTTLYDYLGEEVAISDSIESITTTFDLFSLGDAIYRVSLGGAVTVLKEESSFNAPLTGFSAASEDYYYYLNRSAGSVSVYDKELELVSYWQLPLSASVSAMNVLSGGDVLVQAQKALPSDADDYDVYQGGSKYDLYSYLVNPANGKAKELELDYGIGYVAAHGLMNEDGSDAESVTVDGVDNLALIAYIVEKTFVESSAKLVVLGNDAKIKGDFLPDLKINPRAQIERIGDNLYSYRTQDGRSVLCNAKGETLGYGDVTSYNDSYIIKNNRIFNHSLELVVDCVKDKLTVYQTFSNSIMLTDENGAYKLLIDDVLNTISPAEGIFVIVNTENGYYVTSDGTALTVYNERGDKIETLGNAAQIGITTVCTFDDGSVLVMGNDAATGLSVYYLLEERSESVGE